MTTRNPGAKWADDPIVTVCDSCLTIGCWQGEWMCENYRRAGIKRLRLSDLDRLRAAQGRGRK